MNIHTQCYEFIAKNEKLFDLQQYNQDHSINIKLLNNYVSKQTCSEKYFKLLNYIYKQSTYIDCNTFIKVYTSNIRELNNDFSNNEVIVLFPYLEVNKSNFFFTLYFIHLYYVILSKKINYIFPYKKKDAKINVIDIDKLSLSIEISIIL